MKKNMSILSKMLCAFVLFLAIIGIGNVINVQAATIGERLIEPEAGWKRYDDRYTNIIIGNGTLSANSETYNRTITSLTKVGQQIKFKFSGTKLRIITNLWGNTASTINEITIDGQSETFSGLGDYIYSAIAYEKLDLPNQIHTVIITLKENDILYFDAIDIDENGKLLVYDDSTSIVSPSSIALNKNTLDMAAGQNQTLTTTFTPSNTTYKYISWTSSDAGIAKVDSTGKVTAISKGTAVITATTKDDGDLTATCTVNVHSPKIGEDVIEPEAGWKRYDDRDANINPGSGTQVGYIYAYNKTETNLNKVNEQIKFKFSGTKLRILTRFGDVNTYSAINQITIDGQTETFSTVRSGTSASVLAYEKLDLPNQIHTVTITLKENKNFYLDAIDTDGELLPYDSENPNPVVSPTSISLNKNILDLFVGQTDSLIATILPANSTNKNVIWTSSDNSIVSVDTNGVVTGVTVGTAVITATTVDGGLTATCVVNVNNNSTTGSAILVVTMSNNNVKEYDLSMAEIDKFIEWYNSNSSPSYAITKNYNIKPYTKRTEYLSHDKISSFEVNEYIDN
jgi:uncharacterized protein YjdB